MHEVVRTGAGLLLSLGLVTLLGACGGGPPAFDAGSPARIHANEQPDPGAAGLTVATAPSTVINGTPFPAAADSAPEEPSPWTTDDARGASASPLATPQPDDPVDDAADGEVSALPTSAPPRRR